MSCIGVPEGGQTPLSKLFAGITFLVTHIDRSSLQPASPSTGVCHGCIVSKTFHVNQYLLTYMIVLSTMQDRGLLGWLAL